MEHDRMPKIAENPRAGLRTGLALFLLCLACFSLTLSHRYYGYEWATLEKAREILFKPLSDIVTPAGLMDVLAYVPAEIAGSVLFSPMNYYARDFFSLHTLPFMSALICLIFYYLARDLYQSSRIAVHLTLILALATMIWPYSKTGMEIQHSLWALFALWMLIRWRLSGRELFLVAAGAGAGLLTLTKVYGFVSSGVFGLWLLLDLILSRRERRGFSFRLLLLFTVPLVLCASLMFVQNRLLYGSWLLGARYDAGYEARRIPVWQALWGFLFSSGKSIFIYNPPLVLAVLMAPHFRRRFPRPAGLIVMLIVSGLVFHSLLWIWTDETWGPRKLHYLIAPALLPVGILLESSWSRREIRRRLLTAAVVVGVYVQILGVSVSYDTHPVILMRNNRSSLEYIRYNPRLSHTTVNHAVFFSSLSRIFTGEPGTFVYNPTYFLTVTPRHPEDPIIEKLAEWSYLDFWFVERRTPARGGFHMAAGTRRWLTALLVLLPVAAFLLSLALSRDDGGSRQLLRIPSFRRALILAVIFWTAAVLYNRAWVRERRKFEAKIPATLDMAIGDVLKDELILGEGWRGREWMKNPDDPKFEVPFRWTAAHKAQLHIPCLPGTDHTLQLDIYWVFPVRISVWANGTKIGYVRGRPNDSGKPVFTIPASVIGDDPVCDITIECHEMHVPARVDPVKFQDRSILGVMVHGLRLTRMGSDSSKNTKIKQ